MPDTRTGHVNWGFGHWDFDYEVSDSEGLSLLNGRFRGFPMIGKFSMPVIRVKYLTDGGWQDWRRPIGLGAGPYADQIRWHLGGSHGLQRIVNRGNEYVAIYEFLVNSVRWLELGVYARIGAYHIYQAWFLNEEGIIQPHVWSKGLTINMDHAHHPYWRLDFDIDGPDHNRVWRFDADQGWRFYPREANDAKKTTTTFPPPPRHGECVDAREKVADLEAKVADLKDQIKGATGSLLHGLAGQLRAAQTTLSQAKKLLAACVGKPTTSTTAWYVRNERTFNGAWLLPGPEDGNPDGFSGIDMAVRLYRPDQDIGWPFGANGIGFSKGEAVDDNDVVFWYVAHLYHHASEGGDAWHGAGPTIILDVPPPPPLPLHFSIDLHKRRDQFGGEVIVTGTGFTPGGQVKISYLNIPRRVGAQSGATSNADASGKFRSTDYFKHTSRNPDDAFLVVEVDALDVTSGLIAKAYTSATIWVP